MNERSRVADLGTDELLRRLYGAIHAADHSRMTDWQRARKWRFVGSAWAELQRRQRPAREARQGAGGDAD